MDEDRQTILKTASSSGEISDAFVNISDVFTQYSEIPTTGFNTLYKAQRFGKWFVLKGLKAEYRDSAVHRELLNKEFALGILMSHENIVRYYNKETDPIVGDCIVMEFVDGETLSEFMKSSPSKNVCERIALQLLQAMEYYHSLQIVHRDLKPDNILITRNGNNVKIIDFGLGDADFSTVLKQPAGSPKYMAPEQYDENVVIDARADLYAFAIIVRNLWKKMPRVWQSVVNRCAQPNREKRPSNAQEVLHLLAQKQKRKSILVPLGVLSCVLLLIVVFLQSFLRPYLMKKMETPTAFSESAASVSASVQQKLGNSMDVAAKATRVVHDTIILYKEKADLTVEMKQFLQKRAQNYWQPFWDLYRKHDVRLKQLLAGEGIDKQRDMVIYNELLSVYGDLSSRQPSYAENKIFPALKEEFPDAKYVDQFEVTTAYYNASNAVSLKVTNAVSDIYIAIGKYDK